MRCVTWSRDSHGLFDYESRYIQKKNIKTQQSGRILRVSNDVEFYPEGEPVILTNEIRPLLSIVREDGRFYIHNDTLDQPDQAEQNTMFVVVRNVKSQPQNEEQPRFSGEYKISKGDTIKMGRLKFLVKDFRSDKTSANMDQKFENSPVKKQARCEDIDDFAEEEEVEIECGIADASDSI